MAQDDTRSRPQRLVEYFISVGVGDEAQPLDNVSGTTRYLRHPVTMQALIVALREGM